MCGGYLTLGPQNNKTQTAAISIIFTTGLREHCNQLRLALPGKYSTLTRDYPMPNQQNLIVFIKLKWHVHGLNKYKTRGLQLRPLFHFTTQYGKDMALLGSVLLVPCRPPPLNFAQLKWAKLKSGFDPNIYIFSESSCQADR